MPNGKPGDHPRTDLTIHKMAVYGEPTDGTLRKLIRLMGQHRFDEWFNPLWGRTKGEITKEGEAKLERVERAARSGGFEVDGQRRHGAVKGDP